MSPRHSTVLSALQRQRDGWRGASRRNMGSGRGTENSGGKPVRGSSRKVREISRDALRKAKPGSLPMHIKSSRYYQLAIQEFVLASSDPNAILQFVKHRIPDMNARCVVTTIYRLSKLSQRSPERDSQSQLSGSDWGDGMNLDFFHENPERKKNSGREEASTSWRHSETFQKLLKRLFFFVEFSHSFRPDLVAQTAVASVGLNFHSKELFEMLMRQALERPKSFSPQELVLLYWSFAKVGHVNAALLFGLSESVRSALSSDSLLPGQLVSMLWSLTQLGLAPSPLLSEALSKVAREVEKYSPRDLAELLWVCAAAEGCSYATFRSLLRHAVKTMVKKDSEGRSVVVAGAQELSVAVWASAVAGVRDEESLKTLSCALAAVLVQSEEDLEDAKFIVESEKSLDRGSSASGGGASGVILPDDISDVRERIRLRRQLVREEAAEKRLQEAMGGTSNKKTKGRGQTGIGDEGEDEEVVDFSPEKWSLGVRGIANMLWGFSVLNFVQPELFRLAISKLRRMGGGGEDGLLRATEGEGSEKSQSIRRSQIYQAHLLFLCLQTLGSGGQGGGKGSDEEVKGSRGGGGLLSEKEAAVFRKSMSASERSKLSASSGEEEEEEIEEGEENPGAQSEKTAVAGAASPQQKTRSRRCVSAVSSSLHSQISDGLHRFLRVDHENEFFAEDALLVDIAFPELKVAIEAEGPFHFKSRGLSRKLNSRTLFKQRLLRALGWKVTSIPFFQWEQKSHRSRSARAAFLLRLLDSDPSTKSLVTPEIREEIEQMKKGKERGERGGSRGSDQEEGVVARTREVNSSSQEEEEEQTEIEPLEDWEADLSVAVQDFPLLPDESSFVLSPLWALRDRFGDWQEVSDAAAFQREAQKRSEERKRKKREKREELIRKREEERLQKEKEEGKEDEPGKESSQGETVLPAESGEEVRGESGVFGMNEAVLREQIPNRSSLSNLEDETEEEETLSQTSLEASRRVMQSLMEEGPIEYLQQEPADQAHELRERARDLAAMRAGEASWASRGRRGKQRQRPAAQIKESGSSFSSSQGTAQT